MLYRLGDVEIWRILDMNAPFKTPEELFPNAPPDVAHRIEALAPNSICPKSGKLIIPIQGFLLKTPDQVILVDTCVGNDKSVPSFPDWHQRNSQRFMASLTAAGVAPEDVDYVLCTHLHTDHIGWNTRLLDGRFVPTFPKARYIWPASDEAAMAARNDIRYQESVSPVIAAGQAETVTSDHELGKFVRLIPTPGHTAGHVSILIKSGGVEGVITGDAIHSTAQCSHPEWHFKYDDNPELAVQTRKALLGGAAESAQIVFGSHFVLPSLGRVKAQSDRFIWQAL